MRKRRESKDELPNPRLRRKMLERWENEGGKVGEIEMAERLREEHINTTDKRHPRARKTK